MPREKRLTRVCVFCGSSLGIDPSYRDSAQALGLTLAERGLQLIYGGASIGLMGVLADAALGAGGQVTGVIPRTLIEREIGHPRLTDLRVVGSMHERKAVMAELADAFIALPGGFGTLDELCEILTWAQLGLHRKPCGILNASGYFDGLLAFFDNAVSHRFLQPEHRSMLVEGYEARSLLDRLNEYEPSHIDKLAADET